MKEIRRRIILFSLVVIFTLLFCFPTYFFIIKITEDIKHETINWIIVEDYDGNQLAVDPLNISMWNSLRLFYKTNAEYDIHWILIGVIVSYDNSWQFRLEPSTVYLVKGPIKGQTYSINGIANNLEEHLSNNTPISIYSMRFFRGNYIGIIVLIFDVIVVIAAIILLSLYLFTKREKRISEKIKEALLGAKETSEGIPFALLSQKTGLKQKPK